MKDELCLSNLSWTGVVGAESFHLASWIFLGGSPLALPDVVLDFVRQDLVADIVGAGQRLLPRHQSSVVHSNRFGSR